MVRQVDVSDETYSFIERLAKPFVDKSPEDVLNRELRELLNLRDPILARVSNEVGPTERSRAEASEWVDGDSSRRGYAAEQQRLGRDLVLLRGIWAKYKKELDVALPFANERGGRWWLGVSRSEVEARAPAIVLLCRRREGELLDFVFLPERVLELASRLTVASNNQYMFNVMEDGGRFFLAIPGAASEDVTAFRGAW